MKILIISATSFEIEPLLTHLGLSSGQEPDKRSVTWGNNTIDIMVTGVGILPTAYGLGKILGKNSYDLAFNFGIAGSFTEKIVLGEVVNVITDRVADLGAEDGREFLDIFELGMAKRDGLPYTGGRLCAEATIHDATVTDLPAVNGITVNKAHGNRESIESVMRKYNPDVESMEGAAFLFSCLSEKVPCFQIRSVSNYVEPRDTSKWNIPLAIRELNKKAIEIIDRLG